MYLGIAFSQRLTIHVSCHIKNCGDWIENICIYFYNFFFFLPLVFIDMGIEFFLYLFVYVAIKNIIIFNTMDVAIYKSESEVILRSNPGLFVGISMEVV